VAYIYEWLDMRKRAAAAAQPSDEVKRWNDYFAKVYVWQVWLRDNIVDTHWFTNAVLFLVLINFWFATLYGTLDSDALIDDVTATIMLIYALELAMKIFAFGWDEFWNYNEYHPGRAEKMRGYAYRYDFVVISISLIAFVIAHGIAGSYELTQHHVLRALTAIPVLRIFSVVENARNTLFGVLIATAAFIPVFFLLLLLFYCYAVVGVYLFAGDENYYLPTDVEPNSTFDQIHFAGISLFQVLTGQNWDIIMYVHLYTFGFGAAWFFLSFVILFGLVYTQLVIGMVVDGYLDSVKEAEEDEKEKIVEKQDPGKERKKRKKQPQPKREHKEKEKVPDSPLTEKKRIDLPIVEEEDEKDKSPGLEHEQEQLEGVQEPSQRETEGENVVSETEMVTARVESETPSETPASTDA